MYDAISGFVGTVSSAVTAVDILRSNSPAIKRPIETVNIEPLANGVRCAMFPYAPEAKIKIEEFALNFDWPYKLNGYDTKSVTRKLSGDGRYNFIIVARIANGMIHLFPPIPPEPGKNIEDITKIYLHIIKGLKFIHKKYFSDFKITKSVPDYQSFDFEYDEQKYPQLTDYLAADAIQKTVNLFEHHCKNKIEVQKLQPFQIALKNSYTKQMITHFANALDLLRDAQADEPLTNWVCENQFKSLDFLVKGRIFIYQNLVMNFTKLITKNERNEDVQKQVSSIPPKPMIPIIIEPTESFCEILDEYVARDEKPINETELDQK